MLTEFGFGAWDVEALGFFVVTWFVYGWIADSSRFRYKSITASMDGERLQWMQMATRRELRVIDTGVMSVLVTGISFFASTTIFVIGGLIAALVNLDKLPEALDGLPFALAPTVEGWALHLIVMLAVFIYAFFKFAWAFRLANYCSILIGGLPHHEDSDTARDEAAARAAGVSSLSGHHFNRGLRAYFFALALLAWFVHPFAFMAATVCVVLVLVRREFLSSAASLVGKS